jgi:hypothetical protein
LAKYHFEEAIDAGVAFARTQGGHGSENRTGEIMRELTSYGTAAQRTIPALKELIGEFNAQCQRGEYPAGELHARRVGAVEDAIQSITAATSQPELRRAVAARPIKVFILAGQSNMEGAAVVDLTGKDYNDGRGTLVQLLNDPVKGAMFKHLRGDDGGWTVRDDVRVSYQREQGPLLAGPLGLGFSVYGDQHHFGPELQFGHVVGDAFEEPILLIKTAWGGKSLDVDFRPPSSGGTVGPYYTKMIAQVREAVKNLQTHTPGTESRAVEIAGFGWWHGWNDFCPASAVPAYEQNLVNLIHDVRKDLGTPGLPVVIAEFTGPWLPDGTDLPAAAATIRQAQAAVAARPEFKGTVVFVPTRDFVRRPDDSPHPGHGHHEFGNAETYFLVGDAMGRGMLGLLGK